MDKYEGKKRRVAFAQQLSALDAVTDVRPPCSGRPVGHGAIAHRPRYCAGLSPDGKGRQAIWREDPLWDWGLLHK